MLDGRDRAEDWESFFCSPSRLSEFNDLDIGEAEGSLSSPSLSVSNRDFVIRSRLPLLNVRPLPPARFCVVILSI